MSANRVIGAGGKLPWHLPEDFRFFKHATLGGALLMGRRTYESIGRPLPGRLTIVLSRTMPPPVPPSLPPETAVRIVRSLDDIWEIAPERPLFLAGGAELYAAALPLCDELLLTHVAGTFSGDAFFPEYETFFDAGEVLETHPGCVMRRHRRRAPGTN